MNKPSGLRQEAMLVEIKFNDKKFKTKFMTVLDQHRIKFLTNYNFSRLELI